MRLLLGVVFTLALQMSAIATPASAADVPGHSREAGLSIRVEGEGWDAADREEIESVLYSVADRMLAGQPKPLAAPIIVSHSDTTPITLYERGAAGEYLVHLHASGNHWALYVYEFAHELCHIMSNFDERGAGTARKYNQWFDEVLCEATSRFALRSVALHWQASPSGSSEHGRDLLRFYDMLAADAARQRALLEHTTAWLDENVAALRRNPYQREKNDLLAVRLLPLFEQNRSLGALRFLDLDRGDDNAPLDEYVRHWYVNAPVEQRPLVRQIMAVLGVSASPADAASVPVIDVGQAVPRPEFDVSLTQRSAVSK